ncbi:hypothetical protein [uncultured Hydrogenophaga sp.]|nr:hypothetical protein [uncultured Hydrogenophaga sp.]
MILVKGGTRIKEGFSMHQVDALEICKIIDVANLLALPGESKRRVQGHAA